MNLAAEVPVTLVVGLGLRPHTPADRILRAIRAIAGDSPVACLATLDRRATEDGVRAAAGHFGVPVLAYDAETLAAVEVPNPGERTRTAIGSASVAEAAALLAARGPLLRPKRVVDGVVVAAARY